MKFVKGLASTAVFAAVTIIGFMAGETIYKEKIGPWITKKLNKESE